MKKKYKEENKITIIGAGLTGLAFCNLLKDSNIKISIIDSQPKTFYKDVNNERYIVLSNTSKIILEKTFTNFSTVESLKRIPKK